MKLNELLYSLKTLIAENSEHFHYEEYGLDDYYVDAETLYNFIKEIEEAENLKE